MNRESKEVAYSQIDLLVTEKYYISREDYKSKWKIIRSQFMREQALERRKKSGQPTSDVSVPLLVEVVQDTKVPRYCADCHKGFRYNEN